MCPYLLYRSGNLYQSKFCTKTLRNRIIINLLVIPLRVLTDNYNIQYWQLINKQFRIFQDDDVNKDFSWKRQQATTERLLLEDPPTKRIINYYMQPVPAGICRWISFYHNLTQYHNDFITYKNTLGSPHRHQQIMKPVFTNYSVCYLSIRYT
jgi:hypothetical protein